MGRSIRTDRKLVEIFKKLTSEDRDYLASINRRTDVTYLGPESGFALIAHAITIASIENKLNG